MTAGSLRGEIRGRVVLPEDSDYQDSCHLFNGLFPQAPAAIAYVADAEDVAKALLFARGEGLRLTVRSGGTSPAGFSANDGGVVIDVSELEEESLVVRGDGAKAGPGLLMSELYPGLAPHGKIFPGGECPMVALSGLTLGGGISLLSRSLGLTIDSLEGATIVTADGNILDTNDHPDLFWALRGAGSSYGLVTSLRFRLSTIRPKILCGSATWSPRGAARALARVTESMVDAPNALGVEWVVEADKVSLVFVYNGEISEGRQVLDGLLEGLEPARVDPNELPYSDFLMSEFRLPKKGQFYGYWRSGFIDGPPPEHVYETILEGMRDATSPADFVSIEFFNGAVQQVAPADTAFVHRDRLALLGVFGNWLGADAPPQTEWAKELYVRLGPIFSGHYQNYPDRDLDDWQAGFYGENYPRLQALKLQYDPDDIFSFEQSIRLPTR